MSRSVPPAPAHVKRSASQTCSEVVVRKRFGAFGAASGTLPNSCQRTTVGAPIAPPRPLRCLLELHRGARALELGLGLVGRLLGHPLEHGLGGGVDQVLGLF